MRMVGTTGAPWQEPSQGCPSCRAALSPDGDGHPKAERLATAAARMVGAVLPTRSASLSRRRGCVSSATGGWKGPVLENGTCWVLGGWEDPAGLFSTSKAIDKLVLRVEIQTCWSIAVSAGHRRVQGGVVAAQGILSSVAWLWVRAHHWFVLAGMGKRPRRKEKSVSALVLNKWLLSLGSAMSLVTLQRRSGDKMGPHAAQGTKPQGLGHATCQCR